MTATNSEFSSVISIFERFESITHYQMCLFSDNAILYPSTEQARKSPLANNPAYATNLLLSDGIVQDAYFHEFFYYVQHCTDKLTYIMGPFCPTSVPNDMQREFSVTHHISDKFQNVIHPASVLQVSNAASLINDLLEKENIHPFHSEDIDSASTANPYALALTDAEQTHYQEAEFLRNSSEAMSHTPYELEQDMLDALKVGDLERFQLAIEKISDYNIGEYASNSVKQTEYSAVMMITAFTRAVIEGGVSTIEAYSLSDRLLYKLSAATGKNEYQSIMGQVISQYAALIHRHRGLKDLSPHIRKCQSYIYQHLNQDLSPEILADQLGISRDYLLHLFSQSVGIPLMEYVRRERIEAACRMLKYSNYSIQRIADYYHFKNQSRFARVFREQTGLTPSQYRRQNKPTSFL